MATTEWCGVWEAGRRVERLHPADRGLGYGDGLFETLRAQAGTLPWWPRHDARLRDGARRLGLTMPASSLLESALAEALEHAPDGVLKLTLTRGVGPRGYAPSTAAPSTLVLATFPAPTALSQALNVDLLDLFLGTQPVLAGIKHLNRLEQVLGAGEAAARGLDDGLMADAEGRITCSTRANVFACIDGRWRTPPIIHCGVAGVARAALIDAWPALQVAELPSSELPRVDALFLANAVRGILPVGRLGARALDVGHPGIAAAHALLADSHPAFRET